MTDAVHPVQSGSFHSPLVWGGQVPSDGAVIHIPAGIRLTVSRDQPGRFSKIEIDGELRLTKAARLNVETIMVHAPGTFRVVRPAPEITVTFIDTGAIPVVPGSHAPGRGLISEGLVDIRGERKTPFARVLTFTETTVTLQAVPSDWRVGDTVVIPSNRFRRGEPFQTAERVITAITDTTLTLDSPINPLVHVVNSPRVQQVVANLTRSITFRSENPETSRRGHVRIQHTASPAIVQGAAFVDLGRTDKSRLITPDDGDNPVGIYPVHVHHTGVDSTDLANRVRNCVVIGSPGWGIVVHGSRALVDQNVVYSVVGAGIVAEDGNERGRIMGNVCVNMTGTGTYERDRTYIGTPRLPAGDFAYEGAGIWTQSPLVFIFGNVAANCHGPALFHHHLGIGAHAVPVGIPRKAVDVEHGREVQPLRHWDGNLDAILPIDVATTRSDTNVGIACFVGLKMRFVQSTNRTMYRIAGLEDNITTPVDWSRYSYLYRPVGFASWNCETGAMLSYLERYTVDLYAGADDPVDIPLVEGQNPTTKPRWIGIQCHRQNAREIVFNGTVEGYPIGAVIRYPGWPTLNVAFSGCTHDTVVFDPRAEDT